MGGDTKGGSPRGHGRVAELIDMLYVGVKLQLRMQNIPYTNKCMVIFLINTINCLIPGSVIKKIGSQRNVRGNVWVLTETIPVKNLWCKVL